MRKRSNPQSPLPTIPVQPMDASAPRRKAPPGDDHALLQNLIGLGDFSARKSYYPELLSKIDEIEQEKERYEWLFEHALHGIFQARIDGPVTAANPAIARICGYASVEDFLQIDDIRTLFHPPEDYPRLLKLLHREGQKVGFETQLVTASGGLVHISTNVLLKDKEQGLIEAFVQDITERKRAQAELTRLNAELEQRVLDRTRELVDVNLTLRQEITEREQVEQQLEAAKQEAIDANNSKDKYLAAASHDLLQPLNAARLLVSTLQQKPQSQENQQLVERVHIALEGAEALLTDLLEIARLDANAVTADLSLFAIDALIQPLITEFEPVAHQQGLAFKALSSQLIVRSDARLLMRILRNLISNAIRYTEQGRVLLGCRRRGHLLELQVWDTGPGIPADKQQQIFQEFQQLDSHPGGNRQGVGLGLAIVKRIAQMLGHPVLLRSHPGKGACFSIQVPISQRQPLTGLSQPAMPTEAIELNGQRVLVIENEESIRVGMRVLLETWGCRVETAANVTEALPCFDGLPADIILADYHLDRGLTGLDVIEALQQRDQAAGFESPPAVMITADHSDEVLQQFKQHQLMRLNKPVKPGKLRALMSHLLKPN